MSHSKTTTGQLMKFDPTINTGTIIQTLVFVVSVAVAYGAYREDQTRQDGRITQVEVLAAKDTESTKDALRELRTQMADLQKSNQDIKDSLAFLRGRAMEGGPRK